MQSQSLKPGAVMSQTLVHLYRNYLFFRGGVALLYRLTTNTEFSITNNTKWHKRSGCHCVARRGCEFACTSEGYTPLSTINYLTIFNLTNFISKLVIKKLFYSETRLVGLIEMHTKSFKLTAIYKQGLWGRY